MEPVFMMLGEAAGLAATYALENQLSLHNLGKDYFLQLKN